MSESNLISEILLTIGTRPDVRLWRSQPIVAQLPSGRRIRALPKGHPDITGVVSPLGRALYIECKSPTGRLSTEQAQWRDMLQRFGALWVLARSVDDVTAALATVNPESP